MVPVAPCLHHLLGNILASAIVHFRCSVRCVCKFSFKVCHKSWKKLAIFCSRCYWWPFPDLLGSRWLSHSCCRCCCRWLTPSTSSSSGPWAIRAATQGSRLRVTSPEPTSSFGFSSCGSCSPRSLTKFSCEHNLYKEIRQELPFSALLLRNMTLHSFATSISPSSDPRAPLSVYTVRKTRCLTATPR